MPPSTPRLPPDQLFRACDPADLPFGTTAELADLAEPVGQERAVAAIRFGVGMEREGYNLFVLGPSGSGKRTLLEQILSARAKTEPAADNWCYVNNFAEPHRPYALRLPPGRGVALAEDMRQLVEDLQLAIPAAFESEEYRARVDQIDTEFNTLQEKAFGELGRDAAAQDIALIRTPAGFSFAPMKNGEVISPDDYEQLGPEARERIRTTVATLQERLEKLLYQVPAWRKAHRERVRELNREVTLFAVGHPVDELKRRYAELPRVIEYLEAVQRDVVDNVDEFRHAAEGAPAGQEAPSFRRYKVNLLRDHTAPQGAPVVFQDFPSYQNLIGRVEHLAQQGTLVTDFGLIKAGALHRANGGYLLLEVDKVLRQPFAWEGLKRALVSRQIQIESLGELFGLVRTVSLEPEPIPLDVKVVLFGERWLYYLLYAYDPDFCELFKVQADFEDELPRTAGNHALCARLVASIARREALQPLARAAVARLIEHQARLAGDAERISLHMQSLVDLMLEADHWAREGGSAVVALEHVQRAIDLQVERGDRLRRRMNEETLRGTLLIASDGARVGQINALSVLQLGGTAFGHPTRITARTRLGEGGVVDIQREVKLGGAIHSKGVLILSAFLAARYSGARPHSLSASLTFEQTYGEVEGDSASVAELCVLLSSLADVPIRQSLAVTGSVNQHGEVQAVGGVNEKIEGFFDLCSARGLSGEQGVLIPVANVKHLMLRRDVVDAAAAGRFHVYPIATVDEALELLTGWPAGDPETPAGAPAETVNGRVKARLARFAHARQGPAGAPARVGERRRWPRR